MVRGVVEEADGVLRIVADCNAGDAVGEAVAGI